MKKFLAILVTFCMVFSMVPLTASAAGEIASGTTFDMASALYAYSKAAEAYIG